MEPEGTTTKVMCHLADAFVQVDSQSTREIAHKDILSKRNFDAGFSHCRNCGYNAQPREPLSRLHYTVNSEIKTESCIQMLCPSSLTQPWE